MRYSINDYNAGREDPLGIDDIIIPFSLIEDITKKIFDKAKYDTSDKFDLSKYERLILLYLSRHSNVTQLDIAKATNLKPPTVSITIKRMVEKGLVQRTTDPYDQRALRVTLSEKGEEVNEKSIRDIEMHQKKLLTNISKSEIKTLTEILSKMLESIGDDEE